MDLSEAVLLLGKIKSIYTRFYFGKTEDDILLDAESWSELLYDVSLNEAIILLRRYASTNKWPPSPADLRSEMMNVSTNFLTEGEAWEKAMKLTKTNWFGYGVQTEMNYLDADDITIKAWQIIGMETIAMTPLEDIGVTRSNFIRIYNTLKDREEKESALPECLKLTELKKNYLQKNEQKLIENKKVTLQEKIIQNALIKASEEIVKHDVSTEEKILWLQKFKQKLKSGT